MAGGNPSHGGLPFAAVESKTAETVDCRIEGLEKRYDDGTTVLRGVDLRVGNGESVALIGSNGAGKSTLLRCCLRLIEPSAGSIRMLGQDVRELDGRGLRGLRARVGFVFQKHNLVPRVSALSNVIHGSQARSGGIRAWFQGLAQKSTREEAMHCLGRVGLADRAAKRADQLSGGQSQRVAIARTLMQRPDFVIADEPVASLDPAAGEDVMNLFVRLLREDGITLLYTSHNLRHAIDYADRVVALKSGLVELDTDTGSLDVRQLDTIYA